MPRALRVRAASCGSTPRWGGHAERGTGLINNELCIGKLVWNRLRYIKDLRTGKRVSRLNPPEAWIVTEVPELRIVDDALWRAAKDRQNEIATLYAIRDMIERITLSPGPGRGKIDATLHGDFRTFLEWTQRQKNKTDTPLSGVSVSVVAGAGFEPATFRL